MKCGDFYLISDVNSLILFKNNDELLNLICCIFLLTYLIIDSFTDTIQRKPFCTKLV